MSLFDIKIGIRRESCLRLVSTAGINSTAYKKTSKLIQPNIPQMGHFAPRVAPKRVNRKFPVQIAQPRKNLEKLHKPRKP